MTIMPLSLLRECDSSFRLGGSLSRANSARAVAQALTDSQLHQRRLTADLSRAPLLRFDRDAALDEGDGASIADGEGGVEAHVLEDLKAAFGTDFQVDDALIQAILRRNCIAFVGAGFSQKQTGMTWDSLIQKLLVMLPCANFAAKNDPPPSHHHHHPSTEMSQI